jgi:hypothetical protein
LLQRLSRRALGVTLLAKLVRHILRPQKVTLGRDQRCRERLPFAQEQPHIRVGQVQDGAFEVVQLGECCVPLRFNDSVSINEVVPCRFVLGSNGAKFGKFVGGGVVAVIGQFKAGPIVGGPTVYLAAGGTGGFPDVVNVNAATPPFLFSGNFAVRAAANGVGYNGGGAGACAPITGFGTVGDAAASNAWTTLGSN